jgi:toxin ParE1/3/4
MSAGSSPTAYLSRHPGTGTIRDDIRPNLRVKGYARDATIAFSVNVSKLVVAIHGVFYGGQDFERVLRETDGDD